MSAPEIQAEYFGNRLAKRKKELAKRARKAGIECYRLYDRDIPEVPLCVDLYVDALVMYLYERPYEKDESEERAWLELMLEAACERTGVARENAFLKLRARQKGLSQYERQDDRAATRVVAEYGHKFKVNLSDYLDTGLFLDHRETRRAFGAECQGARALNLFCYTGAFSVYAAAGGAATVDSVDLSNTYLTWLAENMALNGFSDAKRYRAHRSDAREFLRAAARSGSAWDRIVLDPPTFSNSAKTLEDFDINADWPALVAEALAVLAPGGKLWFSTNSRKLKFDPGVLPAIPGLKHEDLSASSIPFDFRNERIHRLWVLSRP